MPPAGIGLARQSREAEVPMKQAQHVLTTRAKRQGLHEITHDIESWVRDQAIRDGLLTVLLTSDFFAIREEFFLSS